MKIGFTGTQKGMTEIQDIMFEKVMLRSGVKEFHHGDCIGTDAKAHDIIKAAHISIQIVIHPPISSSKRAFRTSDRMREPKPYLDRNKDIVNETEQLIATPGEMTEQLRSGTWSTIRYAVKMKRSVTIIYPDGSIAYRFPNASFTP